MRGEKNEDILDTLSLDEYLIENKEATYLVKVANDGKLAVAEIEKLAAADKARKGQK